MKNIFTLISLILIFLTSSLIAQNTGDTIVVETFNYTQTHGSGIRDTLIEFPNITGQTYEKILMKYNIRCKDGNVSPGISGQTNIGCGEWDYSCNTYIHDSTAIDSVLYYTPSHTIGGISNSTYSYTTQPTYSATQYIQPNMVLSDIINEVQSTVGNASIQVSGVFLTPGESSKSQFLYLASEMTAAGLTSGEIDGIIFNAYDVQEINYTHISMKNSSDTILNASTPQYDNWTEVFNHNYTTTLSQNRFQFYQPFIWDGISNIIFEFSFTNNTLGNFLSFDGHPTTDTKGIHCWTDKYHIFNGSNYIAANNYKGIGENNPRTVEAWIKTSVPNKEITSWGENATGEKWVFRVNGNGELRVEVNGGYQIGTTILTDNEWHHVAATFDGTNVTDVKLYVDGNLEAISSNLSELINTDAINGINVRVSRGVNDRYFDGYIDDVRIWSVELPENVIKNYMYEIVENSHPFFNNLELNYQFSEGPGVSVLDVSGNSNNATVINGSIRGQLRGNENFKNFLNWNYRPDITFLQGNYSQTLQNDTVIDTVTNPPNIVTEYEILPQFDTLASDIINEISSFDSWEATYNYIYNESGTIIDSVAVAPEGTINITNLPYYKRWPAKYEIMSFVTPYGINLDMGMTGKTWTFDMTDFAPVLVGQKRMTIERGGQWQEDMDIKFLFILGTPPADVLEIKQLWRPESRSYLTIISDRYFAPLDIELNANAESFKIRTAITGHGQDGEFIPRQHFVDIDGGSHEFTWQVWKECAENPVYPQGGTWIYDRAGWCPGMATDIKHNDITPYVTAGQTSTIDYGVITASGTSNYIANNQLVTYGQANHVLDIAVIDIVQPSNKVEYARLNSICNSPRIIIKNTGSTALTTATIKYWVNDANTPEEFEWTGNLSFMKTAEVYLPSSDNLWSSVLTSENVFHVEVSNPNGSMDEYSFNNLYNSNFELPEVVPADIIIMFRTNLVPSESRYEVRDESGSLVFSRNSMNASTTYYDTLHLSMGCYNFRVFDTGDDGIDFWANNDGSGYVKLKKVGGSILKTFEPDFGDGINYNFTVDFPLSYEEIHTDQKVSIFPNPVTDILNISLSGFSNDQDLTIYNTLGQIVFGDKFQVSSKSKTEVINISSLAPGIYYVNIRSNDYFYSEKITKL